MSSNKDPKKINYSFAKTVASESGVDLFSCYQCRKCTNGCPVTFAMDYYPHQIIRMAQLGFIDEINSSKSIWLCSACETCFTRCPNQIDIPKLMDYLKHQCLAYGKRPAEIPTASFHEAFLSNIKRFGRANETILMIDYHLKTARREKRIQFQNILNVFRFGIKLLKKGRLSLLPLNFKRSRNRAINRLFGS